MLLAASELINFTRYKSNIEKQNGTILKFYPKTFFDKIYGLFGKEVGERVIDNNKQPNNETPGDDQNAPGFKDKFMVDLSEKPSIKDNSE
jgi:isocitrate dehydrogenase